MLKFILVSMLVLLSLKGFAFTTTCEFNYSFHKTETDMSQMKQIQGEITKDDPFILEHKGFTFEATLERKCASDSGPCRGYELFTTISKGDVEATGSAQLPNAITYFTQLKVGKELVFVNCTALKN